MIHKNRQVDAIQIKRQGTIALAALLADMTPEQQRRFWEERTRVLLQRQQAKRTEHPTEETLPR
jgi:hypothetical protein